MQTSENEGVPVPILTAFPLDQKLMPSVLLTPVNHLWSFPMMLSNLGVYKHSARLSQMTRGSSVAQLV